MLFLFVHCFVINLVNGLRSFLRKVLGLFYVKIHVLYILAHKSIRIKVDPLHGHQKMSKS